MLLHRRHENGFLAIGRHALLHGQERALAQQIDLVKNKELRLRLQLELLEYAVHDHSLLLPRVMAGVDHMQEQVRLARLFERRTKRGDQMVRELADEADGISYESPRVLTELHLTRE